MGGTAESPRDHTVRVGPFPDGLSAGSTVLVAGTVDPATHAVGLRVLSRYGSPDDTALVVTATEGADQTVERYEAICQRSAGPSIGLVDTTSERQSVSALYEEHPVVFVPSHGDLERLVVGLSDLTGTRPPASGTRHLAVRSLTPVLEQASIGDVCRVLDRISGLRTGSGMNLFGLDYTAHGEETMAALTEQVDGILWVTEHSEATLEFEYRSTRGRYNRSEAHGDSG